MKFFSLTHWRRQEQVGTWLGWQPQGIMKNSGSFYLSVLPVSVYGCYFMAPNGCTSTAISSTDDSDSGSWRDLKSRINRTLWWIQKEMGTREMPRVTPEWLIGELEIFPTSWGFPGGSEVEASASNAGNPSSIPRSGRSPGEGNGNPLQYSCLENPMDRGAW